MPSNEKLPIPSEDEEEEGLCLDNAAAIDFEFREAAVLVGELNEAVAVLIEGTADLKEIDPPEGISKGGIPIRGFYGGDYILSVDRQHGTASVEDIKPR